MSLTPYYPAEDTYLLIDNLQCGKKVLDMGTGTGEVAIYCAKLGSIVTAVDINEKALMLTKKRAVMLKITVIKSDLFDNVKGKYNTITFNPPYLPGNVNDDPAIFGGKHGTEIIERFLKVAWKYLEPQGEIYIIFSSYNNINMLHQKYMLYYSFKLLTSMKLAFHSIYCYVLQKKER